MLVSKPGSIDGIHVQIYEQGEEYDLPPDLAHAFMNLGCAELVDNIPIPGAIGEVEYPQVEFKPVRKSVKRKKR